MNRIAIEGWSYGGFMSLMALAKHNDVFKVSYNLIINYMEYFNFDN